MKPDFTPAQPWRFIAGDVVARAPVVPKRLTSTICAGRLDKYTIDCMIATVETAKILNRIAGKHDHHGVPS